MDSTVPESRPAPIDSVDAVFEDPQVLHRGLMIGGDLPGLASPIVIGGRRQVAERASRGWAGPGESRNSL